MSQISEAPATTPSIELRDVSVTFGGESDLLMRLAQRLDLMAPPRKLRAVDGVSLSVGHKQVVGLVGESGCGKSTLGRVVAGIRKPSSGKLYWHGHDVDTLDGAEFRRQKLRTQMIFQNPFASLNGRMQIGDIVGEAPSVHRLIKGDKEAYIDEYLDRAGLDVRLKQRYPHQLSGGQRQRVGIARALAVQPDFLVCDESVAALDVSIQAQIINLFMDLRESLDLSYLFISHDLGVVEHISDRVAVMYLGRIVEEAPTADIFSRPNHPYTQALLAEVPRIDTTKRAFSAIKGELPSPINAPPGCHFHPRCPFAMERCKVERPALKPVASGHLSACHLNDDAVH